MPHRDPEKAKAYWKKYHAERYLRNKEEIRARNKIWHEENRERAQTQVKRRRLMTQYGITPEQVDELLVLQGGRCAICDTPDPGGSGFWHIDHDHATGLVRGLLCLRCNVGLGSLADSPERLLAALSYLADPPFNDL